MHTQSEVYYLTAQFTVLCVPVLDMDIPEKQCPICYEVFPGLTRMCRDSTQHEACGSCVQRLKEQNMTCAMCRGPLHDHVYPTLPLHTFVHMVQIDMHFWTPRDWDRFNAATAEERAELFNWYLGLFRQANPHVIIGFEIEAVNMPN